MVGENKICECRGEGAETKNEPVIERRAAQGTDKDIGKTVERRIESESASLSAADGARNISVTDCAICLRC